MNFITRTEDGETKTFNKLDEAFEYAEDEDEVESISFTLPTDEKVVLTRSLTGWEYDPYDATLLLSDFEIKVLEYVAVAPAEDEAPEEYWDTMDDLIDRGLLQTDPAKSNADVEHIVINNRGMRALQLHQKP